LTAGFDRPRTSSANASPPTTTVSIDSVLSTGRPRNAHSIIHADTDGYSDVYLRDTSWFSNTYFIHACRNGYPYF